MAEGGAVDEAFIGAGKNVGLEIWRIEKMQVVPVDPETYGQFHTGDSYIVLSTRQKGRGGRKYEWNIHFWLGTETSQGEAGVAAYKTVELDDSLGGAPVQHREVQGHESKLFLSYFHDGLQYLAGGVESGFRHVDRDHYEPRLLQVKGHRNIRVQEVRRAWSSLNTGDVFILDEGLIIWVLNGKEASRLEKIKGLDVARRIRDEERGGRAEIKVVEEEELERESHKFIKSMDAVLVEEGTHHDIQPATCDTEFDRASRDLVKLYRVSDASGELETTEVGSYPLKMGLLDTKDAFILDTASGSIFVWLGKESTKNEKKAAFQIAADFVHSKDYPMWTNVSCIHESCETPIFKQNFTNWKDKEASATPIFEKEYEVSHEEEKFDVSAMLERGRRESQAIWDDGTGELKIWRVENFELQEVDPELYGQFYSGDCYVLLYTYSDDSGKQIIYFWLGQESTQDERASAAIHAVALDDELNGAPIQVRVVQNKEPDHFLLIFKGKLVVHSGGVASGFKNVEEEDTNCEDDIRLFQVRGTNDLNCRAIQVKAMASSLNTNDCFILDTLTDLYAWYGKGCSEEEQHFMETIATILGVDKEPQQVMEGEESAEFWFALGGEMEYASGRLLEEVLPSHEPRLFQVSNASGKISVEEIYDFAQEDLIPEDVMILDTYDEVFVWIGRYANEEEKKHSLTIATEYIESDPSGREPDSTSILMVRQGFEPLNFSCYFMAWNSEFWSRRMSYEAYKESIVAGVVPVAEELQKYDESRTLTYEELQGNPEGIDLTKKETYLSDQDFLEVMGMSRDDYYQLPVWKQRNLKKKAKLF